MAFSIEERDRRFGLVRANMSAEGLDALIVFGSTAVGGSWNGNFTYLSNFLPFFSTSLIFFPREGEPAMFIPGENQILDSRRAGWIADTRMSGRPVKEVCALLAARSPAAARIGISSLGALPSDAMDELRAQFPKTEFIESTAPILAAREAKSAEELAAARRGGLVADKGWERALEVLRPGLTDLQLIAEMENVMTAEGADVYFDMLSAGRPEGEEDVFRGFVVPPTGRAFKEGDLALLEITPRVEGYWSQIVRLVSFGPPPEAVAKAHAACLDAKHKALAHLKAGERFADLAGAIGGALEAHGFSMKKVGSAHTTGLDLSESMVDLVSERVFEPGMLVTLHPMTATGDWRQLFLGESYAVTENGYELLNRAGEELAVIG